MHLVHRLVDVVAADEQLLAKIKESNKDFFQQKECLAVFPLSCILVVEMNDAVCYKKVN